MELKNFFAQDDQGNKLPGATCYLYQRGTESLVEGLIKANGVTLSNPFTSGQDGLIQLAAPNGLYDLRVVSGDRDYRLTLQFGDVTEMVLAAETAARQSESARDTLNLNVGRKPDIATGLLQTVSGQNFTVLASNAADYIIEYENRAGIAVEIKRYPSSETIQILEADFRRVVRPAAESELLVRIQDEFGVDCWMQARQSDGGPTELTKDLFRKGMPGLPNIGDVEETILSFQDDFGNKLWLQAAKKDGGLTRYAAECVQRALKSLEPAAVVSYVAEGDSMTASNYGGGDPYPVTLAALLGKSVINTGISGTTATEVSLRAGGDIPLLTLPGGVIPATTDAIVIDWDGAGPFSGTGQPVRSYTGSLRGIPCSLKYSPSTGAVTVNRITAGASIAVGSPVPFVPDVPHMSKSHIVWAGRNDYPKSSAYASLDKLLSRLERERAPYLILSVCNTTTEPLGSSGYADVIGLNLQLLKRAPLAFVDIRGRMIREGLGLAGLVGTATDMTAINEDRIPPSLLDDGLHFNAAGRLACAHIIHNELVLRKMA